MDNPTNPEILFEQWLSDSWEEILKISGHASSSRSKQNFMASSSALPPRLPQVSWKFTQ